MRARPIARAAAVAVAAGLPVLATAAPALAKINDGETPAHEGWVATVLIYVIAPLGFFLLVALITYLPSLRRKPRYRPNRAWDYQAVWFNGPDNPDAALRSVSSVGVKGGGASASW